MRNILAKTLFILFMVINTAGLGYAAIKGQDKCSGLSDEDYIFLCR
jgi:hypothetical protein